MSEGVTLYDLEQLFEVEDYTTITCIRHNNVFYRKSNFQLLQKCTNLEELYLLKSGYDVTELPSAIFKLPKLRTLAISGYNWSIPIYLQQLTKVRVLRLQNLRVKEFFKGIDSLPDLEELDFYGTKWGASKIEFDYIDLSPKLKHLNILSSGLKQLPSEVFDIKNLHELFVPKSIYNTLKKKHADFFDSIPYIYGHQPLEKKYLYTIINLCQKHQYNWSFRAILFNLLAENSAKLQRWATPSTLLPVTDIKMVEIIRLKALEYYHKHLEKSTLSAGASIAVMGKLGTNKKELKQQLKEHKIKYTAKITDKTTHVLIGQLSHRAYQEALDKNLPIITEYGVLDFINQNTEQYLVDDSENDPQSTQQISDLLLSNQDENIQLALMLFKQGGFPIELLTELFIAYKQSSDAALRRDIERLLRQYGSAGLIDEVKQKQSLASKYTSEKTITRRLNQWSKRTELDINKIAWYIHKNYKKGIPYLLKHSSSSERKELLAQQIHNGTLFLTRLDLTSLPSEVFELTTIHTLDLSHNHNLGNISLKALAQLPNLKKLILRGVYKFIQQPEKVQALRQTFPQLTITK